MNRNRLLFIGVLALALGLLASSAVYSNLKARSRPAKDIPAGNKINADDVKLVSFSQEAVPANSIRQKADVIGRGVVTPVFAGEFILKNKLAPEKGGAGLPSLIPAGMRAVSVRVNDVVAVAGFVQPETRVDVLLTGNPSGGGEQQTTTILENVRVLAAGQRMEGNLAGEAEAASVITLAVPPDDAQKLTLASTQGRIQLSLRNPLDTKQQDLGSVNATSLYRKVPVTVLRPSGPSKPRPKNTETTPPAPAVYSIEVIKGDKKEETKF